MSLAIESNTWLTESRDFRLKLLGSAYSCDVWAGSGECWQESARVLSVVAEAYGAIFASKPAITRGNEEGSTASTDLGEFLANTLSVRLWHSLLVVAVGAADHLRDALQARNVRHPGQIRFIRIGRCVEIWRERRAASS